MCIVGNSSWAIDFFLELLRVIDNILSLSKSIFAFLYLVRDHCACGFVNCTVVLKYLSFIYLCKINEDRIDMILLFCM